MTEGKLSLQRIMLVEDEEDIRAVAELALEAVGGFTLKTCASGQVALDQLAEFRPQLVLLDVMMPVMDGPSTLHAIRQTDEFADVPAIFMTAKVQPDEVSQYLAEGAVAVIPKPFDPMTLSDRIREIWDSLQ
ncbi:response regulator [Marinobacter salinexigens]|uniref:Response regulator n=1 Tax=Marinobacter salinexigens TaxID=2919747 RepID=A0A5B0VBL9_9GAMM|nr:response regulator [Marinobacter salinexigens]KAA1171451.1 response regulator [Marinobacter salinexigens]